MFGLFREKTLDADLCVNNVTDAILDVWADESKINLSKFNNLSLFRSKFESDPKTVDRIFVEKLVIIFSVVHTLLQKEGATELIEPVANKTLRMAKEILNQDLGIRSKKLLEESERLSTIRNSLPAKEAGQFLEEEFSEFVFKFIPKPSDMDSRYLIYQQVSSLERSAIIGIGSAIRKSKI